MDTQRFDKAADNMRILIAQMVEKAKSGHPGGAMGGTDFINVLFSKYLVYDPADPHWFARDRFFLDPGHMSPMLYSVLALTGRISIKDLQEFRQWGSLTSGHPELDVEHGIENTSGPLGQGHVMAVGSAIAEAFLANKFGKTISHKTYAFISDGGIQEEISQGAGRIAGYLGLNNLIMFYDSNDVQLSTKTNAVTNEDTAAKYRAWNWNVIEIDGGDVSCICDALDRALKEEHKPTLIIGKTTMAKGCVAADGSSCEGLVSTHGQPLSKAGVSIEDTIRNLGGNPAEPWKVFDETKALYNERQEELKKLVADRREAHMRWQEANPDLAKELQDFIEGKLPHLLWDKIEIKPDSATRAASAKVLAELGKCVGNMIVSSADLANSDKTDAFLHETAALMPGDYAGRFLHAGVAELTMAAICNGIVLHGGMMAACATFFVFSDYMKPAIRMSALMELPVKYIFTHDAFRVGEDGPTHQPIEHEAQIRLLEQIKNSKGKPSLLVFRPADAAETVECWHLAMENRDTPTALILSRQDLKQLPAASDLERREAAKGASRGGYAVISAENPDLILVANGSEVELLCQAASKLMEDNINAQVVSLPSIGLFMEQSETYRNSVIPADVPHFGLTAGLPSTLASVLGRNSEVYGMERFGASAPYKVLDDKFGYTLQNILTQIQHFLRLNVVK